MSSETRYVTWPMPRWVKGWLRRRRAKRARAAAAARGEVTFQVVVWDGAGKRWASVGECRPDAIDLLLVDLARSAAYLVKEDREAQARLGWTPPPSPPPEPEGEDPGRPCG